jgi:alpha-glucosidase
MHKLFLSMLLLLTATTMQAKNIVVSSPDGKLKAAVTLDDKIHLSVSADGQPVITDCTLSLDLGDITLGEKPRLTKQTTGVLNDSSKPVVAIKNAVVKNHCNVLTLGFKGNYAVQIRAYDNGVAYRFITTLKGKRNVMNENMDVNFTDSAEAVVSLGKGFETSYERKYSKVKISSLSSADDMTYLPVLVETRENYKVLISEADLHDYPCMFLSGNGKGGFTSQFPKAPLQENVDGDRHRAITEAAPYIAAVNGTRSYPWRFFVISKDDRDIPANQMEYVLSTPNVLKDTSWIRPGKVSWDWWNNWQVWGVDFRAGINYDTYKYYIDFASKYGIEYILLDEGWSASTTDILHGKDEVRLPDLISYGKQKGVKLILWTTWLAVEQNFNEIFKLYSSWGIGGMKIDFMDRSDQWMVNFYERTVKAAADNHLLIDFHGAFKPAGLERMYPNLLAYEGVRGMEQGRSCNPDNSIFIPFIRNAVGPVDFTPGAMLSAHTANVNHNEDTPMGAGTRAYQMALYVVLESGIEMLSDSPTRYMQNPDCTEYIASVPVVWDETRILAAHVGEYIVTARRSGGKWFIGAITNGQGRQITVPLNFLSAGSHTLTAFEDGINANRQALDYKKTSRSVTSSDTVTLTLANDGGYAAVIE